MTTSFNLMLYVFLFNSFLLVQLTECRTHWRVTESGRIESKDDSEFTLLRPYDLHAFIKQAERLQRLKVLKNLLASKETTTKRDSTKETTPVSVATYQENFYKTDSDCIKAGQQLTKFSFYETHLWKLDNMKLPKDLLNLKEYDIRYFKRPDCTGTDLPFSMKTFEHLESIKTRHNTTMLPEAEIMTNLIVESEDFFGHLVNLALDKNRTSWIYLTMASDYFRIKGDFLNSINCLQRAIYYSPKIFESIPKLSLSNMLHKQHFLNDSLILALSCMPHEADNYLFAYYIANVYVTLGDLSSGFNWYDRAATLNPNYLKAILKKHAVSCHLKLEKYLEQQHMNLQKKLDDLKDIQSYSDEWLLLNNKLELEKSSLDRKLFTQKFYDEFTRNSKSTICSFDFNENNKTKSNCFYTNVHFSYFSFENQTYLYEMLKPYKNKLQNFDSNTLFFSSSNNNKNTCSSLTECKQASKSASENKLFRNDHNERNFDLNQLVLERNIRKKFFPK